MYVLSCNAKKETDALFEQKNLETLMKTHSSHIICLQNVEEFYKPPEYLFDDKKIYAKMSKYGGVVVFINKSMYHNKLNLPKTIKTKRVIGIDFNYGNLLNVFYQKFDLYYADLIKYILAINKEKPLVLCISFEDDSELKHESEDEEDFCSLCYKPEESELGRVDHAVHEAKFSQNNTLMCKSKLDEMCSMGFNVISTSNTSHIYCSSCLQKYINIDCKTNTTREDASIDHIIDNMTLNFQKKFIIKSKFKLDSTDLDDSQDTDSYKSTKRKLDVDCQPHKSSKNSYVS